MGSLVLQSEPEAFFQASGRGTQSRSFLLRLRRASNLHPFCEQDCRGILLHRIRMLLRRPMVVRLSTADSPVAYSP